MASQAQPLTKYVPTKYGKNLLAFKQSHEGTITTRSGKLFHFEKRTETEDGTLTNGDQLEDGWYFRKRELNAKWFKVCGPEKTEDQAIEIFMRGR